MLLMKKCGGTPCDRRLDRRKVALAAAAALLVCASSAQAQVTAWQINPAQSFLYHEEFVVFPAALGGPQYAAAQFGTQFTPTGSDYAPVGGLIYTSISGSSIQLANGGLQTLATTGSYFPGLFANGAPDPNNIAPGNYGLTVAGIGATSRDYQLATDVMPTSVGSAFLTSIGLAGATIGNSPMTMNGSGQFNVGAQSASNLGQALAALGNTIPGTGGAEDLTSGLGNDHTSFYSNLLPMPLNTPLVQGGFGSVPAPVQATYAANTQGGIGSLSGGILTIPVDSLVQTSIGGFPLYVQFYGTLVATPAPEPSTITLFGFGVAGLLSYAWRARKRRALVA